MRYSLNNYRTVIKTMSVNAKRKTISEDIESKPKGKKQSTRVIKSKKAAKKALFEKELEEVEVFAIDLVHPPSKVIQIFKKDAQFVQINILGVHLISETLDYYKKNWSYVDTAVNLNGTCWIVLEKIEEE